MTAHANAPLMPAYYLAHGGGPCFFMEWPENPWDGLGAWLRDIGEALPARPSAILVVSAHWEAKFPTVTMRADPPLIYDYTGFPRHTYALTYPAPGSPPLASRVRELLQGANISSAADEERGFDHGVFIPFKLIEPDATIPIVQLSLVRGLDPELHLAIGRALAPLRRAGVLIAGSGMSYHNMAAFRGGRAPAGDQFDSWLGAAVSAEPDARARALADWKAAPQARSAHPREEHLLPLMVVAGAAGDDAGSTVFHDRIFGAPISAYRFG